MGPGAPRGRTRGGGPGRGRPALRRDGAAAAAARAGRLHPRPQRISPHRAGGRPAGADPAAGDRAAGRAGAGAAPRRVLDVGTGSGAIALAIAAELPGCEVIATDTSAARWKWPAPTPSGSASPSGSSWSRGPCPPTAERARPGRRQPALRREAEWGGLEPEVTEWEPREALLAGADGLDVAAGDDSGAGRGRAGAGAGGGRRSGGGGRRAAPRGRLRGDRDAPRPGRDRASHGRTPLTVRQCRLCRAMREKGAREEIRCRLDRTGRRRGGARGAGAVHRRRRRRRLPGRRPLRPRLRPARRGGDRAHPPDQGPRRGQALGGHVPLAAGDARAGRGPRPAHPRGGRRAAARAADAGRRQPRAPLSARLPRGPRAARRPPDRRPAGRGDVPALPDLGQPQRRAAARQLRGGAAEIVGRSDLAIDGGALTGLPSTVVDLSRYDENGEWTVLREGAMPADLVAESLQAILKADAES